jgi:hypothetical protein
MQCVCKKSFGTLELLRAHWNRNFSTCMLSDPNVATLGSVDEGARSLARCAVKGCDEVFATGAELAQHMAASHSTVDRSREKLCTACPNGAWISLKNFSKHMHKHHIHGAVIPRGRPPKVTMIGELAGHKRQRSSSNVEVDDDDDDDDDTMMLGDVDGEGAGAEAENVDFGGGFSDAGVSPIGGGGGISDAKEQERRTLVEMSGAVHDGLGPRPLPVGGELPREYWRQAQLAGAGYAIGPNAQSVFVPALSAAPLRGSDEMSVGVGAGAAGAEPKPIGFDDGRVDNDDDDNFAADEVEVDDDDDVLSEAEPADDDDNDAAADDDGEPVVGDSVDQLRRQLQQTTVPTTRPFAVSANIFVDDVVDVRDLMRKPRDGGRSGTAAFERAGGQADVLRRTRELYALLFAANASREQRETILRWVSQNLKAMDGEMSVLPTEHLAQQAVLMSSPLPPVRHFTVQGKDGAVSVAYYDLVDVMATALDRCVRSADGDRSRAFRVPTARELADARASLARFRAGFALNDLPTMPGGPWASASCAFIHEAYELVLQRHPATLLSMIQFTADETRAKGGKIMTSRVRFLWDPALEWYELVPFDAKVVDQHLVWSTALLPGLSRVQRGVRVVLSDGGHIDVVGDLVGIVGDKQFQTKQLISFADSYPAVHNPSRRRSIDWTKSQTCSYADLSGSSADVPPASWRDLTNLATAFDSAQERHAASGARAEVDALLRLGLRPTVQPLVGLVSLGVDDMSALAAAVRVGRPVLQRPLLLDHRLTRMRVAGSLCLPVCSLHQHQQGLVEHLLEKIAFSIGVPDSLSIAALVAQMPRSPVFDFSRPLFLVRTGKVSGVREVYCPTMSGTQRLHVFRLFPFLLHLKGHRLFAAAVASYLYYLDELRFGSDSNEMMQRWALFNERLIDCVDVFKMRDTVAGRQFAASDDRALRSELLRRALFFPKLRDEWHIANLIWAGGQRIASAGSAEEKHQSAKRTVALHSSSSKQGDSILRRDALAFALREPLRAARGQMAATARAPAALRATDALIARIGALKVSFNDDDIARLLGAVDEAETACALVDAERCCAEPRMGCANLQLARLKDERFVAAGHARLDECCIVQVDNALFCVLAVVGSRCTCNRAAASGTEGFALLREVTPVKSPANDELLDLCGCRTVRATARLSALRLPAVVAPLYVTASADSIAPVGRILRAGDEVLLHCLLRPSLV